MTKPERRHCVRNPETGKFAPSSSTVAAFKTKAVEAVKKKSAPVPSFKKKAAPASKVKSAPAVQEVATPSLKVKAAPASKTKATLATKRTSKKAAKKAENAAKKRAAGKKPLKNAPQESTSGSNSVLEMCRHCYEGRNMCLNWLYGKGKCMENDAPSCQDDEGGYQGHEITQPTLMESLSNAVTKPLMKRIGVVAWKVDDLKEQVEYNNNLNAKIKAFGVHLQAVADKLADLKKVLDGALAGKAK